MLSSRLLPGRRAREHSCVARRAGRRPRIAAPYKLARMEYRKLGWSELEGSEISLGSWLTYSGGVAREQAVACVQAAFDEGVNFIDTANIYGRGAAETFLGEVLSARERSSYELATKLYFPMSASDSGP